MSPRTLADIRAGRQMVRHSWAFNPTQAYLYVKGLKWRVGQFPDLFHQRQATFDAALDELCALFAASMDSRLAELSGGAK